MDLITFFPSVIKHVVLVGNALPAFERTAAELETRIGFLLETIKHTTDSQEVIDRA